MNAFNFLLLLIIFSCERKDANKDVHSRAYFVNTSGSDNNDGSKDRPFKSIEKINSIHLNAGDSVLFAGGQSFNGTLHFSSNTSGSSEKPVIITSYGKDTALINSGNEQAIIISDTKYIRVKDLNLKGTGRKTGNTKDGLIIKNCNHVSIDNINISGYQKSGLQIHSSSYINVLNINAHDNGFAGISVDGDSLKTDCKNITINHCTANDNPGDPTEFKNHSGNGIIVSRCTNLAIQYCIATNNGWDMPRIGNGPVGIWAWDADSVTIEHCISYRNKTSKGGDDGGGFDFDGGVTNSVIQYCLSFENDGSAIGLFEFYEANPWYNNTIRYNISINDGWVSPAKANIFIWNVSAVNKLKDCYIYNNVFYNTKYAAIKYASTSDNEGFRFYNNIFVAKDSIITGKLTSGMFLENDWWSLHDGFNIDGVKDFKAWATYNNQEQQNGKITGINIDPIFKEPAIPIIINTDLFNSFYNYSIPANSVLRTNGINIKKMFGIETGSTDFNGKPLVANGIGASF